MDIITIKSLQFRGNHGYYDHERENGNDFELDVTAHGNFKPAIKKNDLALTFDYENVQKIAAGVLNGPPEKLIETLCFRIGEKIFEQSPAVLKLVVSLRKMNPPVSTPAAYAEITMTWKR